MREKNTKDNILEILRNSKEPLNFEPLFEKVKKKEYCAKMTFTRHLEDLVNSNSIKKEKSSGRDVRYSIVEMTQQGAKILEYQNTLKEQLDATLHDIKNFKHFQNSRKKTEFIKDMVDQIQAILEATKAISFFELSGMVKNPDIIHLKEIKKETDKKISEIFKEIQKKDNAMYSRICMKIFFKVMKNLNSM